MSTNKKSIERTLKRLDATKDEAIDYFDIPPLSSEIRPHPPAHQHFNPTTLHREPDGRAAALRLTPPRSPVGRAR